MATHVDYDTDKRIIYVTTAPSLVDGDWVVDLDIKTDVYSDGKEDWLGNDVLNKFYFPVRSVGGDDLPGEKSLGATFFLDSGWKLRPYEASHIFKVNGNFYSEDGTSPFVSTSGVYNIMVINTVSSLVDSVVQQLAEIEYASFGGGVTLDAVNGDAGTAYPCGTLQEPVNNLTDAMVIATERGFHTIFVLGNLAIDTSGDYSGMIFIGESQIKTLLTISAGANVLNCEFYDAHISGDLDGNTKFEKCLIGDINYVSGFLNSCVLASGIVTLGGSDMAHLLNCVSGVAGISTPVIDMGGSGQELSLRNYNGGIKLINKTGSDSVSLDINSGHVILDSTITNGTIVVRGVGHLTDNSVGATVESHDLLSIETISEGIWVSETADYETIGTFGGELATKADLAASTSTSHDPTISGIIVYGINNSGNYTSTFSRDNTYWEIGEDAADGITVDMTFNLPNADSRPGVFNFFGRYTGQPTLTHHQELWAYNYEATSWEVLQEEFIPGGFTSDAAYSHEYYERHVDRANNNEVKIRIAHHVTTYNASHALYIDYVDISSIDVVTAEEIADAVWANADGVALVSGIEIINQIETGRWKIESNQMIFYEEDNTTEIMRFNLFDEAGDPANTDIFDRRRV